MSGCLVIDLAMCNGAMHAHDSNVSAITKYSFSDFCVKWSIKPSWGYIKYFLRVSQLIVCV